MDIQQKSSFRKISLAGAIIASVCIIIYLVALISAGIRIYLSIDQRRFTAEREFLEMADLASSAGILGFMDESFIETINDALASSRTTEALIISGPEGGYAFERQKGRSVKWVNNAPRFINRFDLFPPEPAVPLRIQGLRNVNIQGVAGSLDYAKLSRILRETLLLILAGLVLASFTLLLESLLGKSGEKPQYADRSPVFDEGLSLRTDTAGTQPAQVSAATPAPVFEEKPGPKGLYSPRSNIGWEEYTPYRIEAELHRCASSEQDLVFIMMEIRNVPDDAFFRAFANEAATFFGSKDLLFEKGKKGISVICPDMDLKTGIAKSGEFHDRVMGKFSKVIKKNDFCLGLSSRSGRLVNAKRLMFEVSQALQRAVTNSPDCPVMAFKTDPDKYRAFIASQNRQLS